MEKPKKQTRRALKEKTTSYNARFVLRYQNLFEESTHQDEEENELI